ncbi:Protein of unknown function (DUF683) [Thioflavicoccus mobilis 8321]|uniref:Rop-like protein n=1 Tax=Thioflavicoccus mobilis 8321 TaxID=765912 RepID=L0GZL8_9GAMM|nr:CCE_0567 family metalloprotein [Thioflavicoccus mobilis]AGA92198.1 Protein of unknown function (DUF683) [Thioflavicoccus mobilis 8321]
MKDAELQALRKEVKRAKRIASEKAGELHDLVEERLPQAYKDIPAVSQACFDACEAWAELNARLNAAEKEATGA